MMQFCGDDCGHDVNFPHYVVINETKDETLTFIFCSLCRHWIAREATSCLCRAGCHSEARYGENEGFTRVKRAQTVV
jgi:hypothetical protein